ncbi:MULTISPECIES: site-2 protease family protein [unclassified Bacillus (in: firmicutes)]|uniref:site-2 protease family protein n=1 Tax=unclassified Bacillus (in: firmicutes) TaxID=185979 RepID=UPI00158718B1|nr:MULTISPECIES: site-2 protease family protein [unclassified Bacillus (in: firmicutes)]
MKAMMEYLRDFPYIALTLVIAFTVHELAHAYVAYKFGDPTAKNQGRITLNPLKHLDPIGTILIFIAGFGWARPVPVNRFFFKKPRLASILVSVAGPISNFILASIGFIVWFGLGSAGLAENMPYYVTEFLDKFIQLNIVLFIFNLLPFPPLDGYRIVEDLMPQNIRVKMTELEKYGSLIFLVLVITPLSEYTISPIFNVVLPVILNGMGDFFYSLFNM